MSRSGEPVIDGGRTDLRPDHLQDGADIKGALLHAGYTHEALANTIGLSGPDERQDVEVICRRVQADTPYNVLVRLFWLGRSVHEKVLQESVPNLDIGRLMSTGLLHKRDGDVCSTAKLAPYHDLLMASDFGPETGFALRVDHVLGVGAASLTSLGRSGG